MNPVAVFIKTETGKARFAARDVPVALRHALILVDGHSTVKELMKRGEGLPHFSDSLEMLEQMGLIAPVGVVVAGPMPSSADSAMLSASGGARVKQQLVALAKRMLDDQAGKIIRKIEETQESTTALMHTVDSCGKVIKLMIDEDKAEAFVLEAKDILGKNC